MRWAIVCALLAVAPAAEARPAPPPPASPQAQDFWAEVVEPNGDRVRALLGKAQNTVQNIDSAALGGDTDWAVDQKLRMFGSAYGILRHARKLSPENTGVLTLLGRVADELGKTREAIDALEAVVKLVGPERAGIEVTGRLGAIYLRLGERDTAIRWLRYAQGPINQSAHSLVHLANALAARGEVTKAADTLQNALPTQQLSYYLGTEVAMVAFALAVIYDRDEQRAAAFEVLDEMQKSLQQGYGQTLQLELAKFRFAPAEDQHYFQALLYESLGHYVEARAEWALYAASGETPWRGRALDHIAQIDRQRRANPTIKPTQVTPRIRRHP